MTLGELMRRQKTPMKPGDYEFVVGSDGLAHRLILVRVDDGRGGDGPPTYEWLCPCGMFHDIRNQHDALALQVAKDLSCMRCNAASI